MYITVEAVVTSFAKKNDTSRMAALKRYRQEIRLLSKKEESDRRRDLLRAALYKYQLSSFGREKMKFLKLSQMNGLDK